MKPYLKIIIGAVLIINSICIAKAVTERTGLISEGLLLAFTFLMFSIAILIGVGMIGKYFEEELKPKKQKEA